MARKLESESDKPADWREDVIYIRNPDGTITELVGGDESNYCGECIKNGDFVMIADGVGITLCDKCPLKAGDSDAPDH